MMECWSTGEIEKWSDGRMGKKTGMMERWKVGILGKRRLILDLFQSFHYSITPIFFN
jgi:hypothetical protein